MITVILSYKIKYISVKQSNEVFNTIIKKIILCFFIKKKRILSILEPFNYA